MKAIIELDVPDYQIGQEVSIYFKDTMMIKAIVQEPCKDAIGREDMLDAIGHGTTYTSEELQRIIKGLPPVTPQPRTGHWEWVQYDYIGNWHCSECRSIVIECGGKNGKGGIPLYKYCPQCGAKMQEVEE